VDYEFVCLLKISEIQGLGISIPGEEIAYFESGFDIDNQFFIFALDGLTFEIFN